MWALFFLATFFIQITFMNMLIAIMQNTFTNVMAKRQQLETKERLNILHDLQGALELFTNSSKDKRNARYLLVIKPKKIQEEFSLAVKMNELEKTLLEQTHNFREKLLLEQRSMKDELKLDHRETRAELQQMRHHQYLVERENDGRLVEIEDRLGDVRFGVHDMQVDV